IQATIYLNNNLYRKIKSFSSSSAMEQLKREDSALVHFYVSQFELQGVNLSQEKKAELQETKTLLARAEEEFSANLKSSVVNADLINTDQSLLEGLSESFLEVAKQQAEEKKK